jgi:hypothetical protein
MKQPLSMLDHDELTRLAHMIDGEGCIAFMRRTDYRPEHRLEVRYDVKIAMTCERTIRLLGETIAHIVGDDLVKVFEERRRVRRRRPLWRVEVSSKRGVYDLLSAVLPYMFTKELEARLCLRYLERALPHKRYHADDYDRRLAEAATALRNGCGEARAEGEALLGQVIPSQAARGALSEGERAEGVEAMTDRANDEPSQERPAPHPHNAEGEEMVRTSGETRSESFNGSRLPH